MICYNSAVNAGGIYIDAASASDILIENCTISDNICEAATYYNSQVYLLPNSTILKNSIISGSSENSLIRIATPFISIGYCDFYNSIGPIYDGSPASGFAVLTNTNINGDSCDIYRNIFLDPLFIDPINGDFHLMQASPAIDAGDPTSPLDPDSTIADIGAFYFDQTNIVIEDVVITIQGNNIHLQWLPIPMAENYKVYASDNPYFSPTTGLLLGISATPEFTHENIVPAGQLFYRIVYEY